MLYGLNAESEAGSTISHCVSAEKWKYLSQQLVQCVRKKIGLEESRATSIVILSVRLMVSLPGSKAQPWHLDYSGTSANCQSVFVNISKSVKGNCTEYVEFESSEDEVKCIERARAALLKSGKISCILKFSQSFANGISAKLQQNKHNQFVKIQNCFFEKKSGEQLICIERSVGP